MGGGGENPVALHTTRWAGAVASMEIRFVGLSEDGERLRRLFHARASVWRREACVRAFVFVRVCVVGVTP